MFFFPEASDVALEKGKPVMSLIQCTHPLSSPTYVRPIPPHRRKYANHKRSIKYVKRTNKHQSRRHTHFPYFTPAVHVQTPTHRINLEVRHLDLMHTSYRPPFSSRQVWTRCPPTRPSHAACWSPILPCPSSSGCRGRPGGGGPPK